VHAQGFEMEVDAPVQLDGGGGIEQQLRGIVGMGDARAPEPLLQGTEGEELIAVGGMRPGGNKTAQGEEAATGTVMAAQGGTPGVVS